MNEKDFWYSTFVMIALLLLFLFSLFFRGEGLL